MKNWRGIRKLGKNKTIQRTYIFLVIVPIIARAFQLIKSPVSIHIGEELIQINFDLPFSWTILFFSALFFTIGSLLFIWKCPQVIQDHESYSSFNNEGKGDYHVIDYESELDINRAFIDMLLAEGGLQKESIYVFHQYYFSWEKSEREAVKKTFENHQDVYSGVLKIDEFKKTNTKSWEKIMTWKTYTDSNLKLAGMDGGRFWGLFNFSNTSRPIAFFICKWSYYLGFGLLGVVFLQNLQFVLKNIFPLFFEEWLPFL